MTGSNLGVARNLFDAFSPQSATSDGSVDSADYVLWRRGFGGVTEQQSATGDGRVDAADYLHWQSGSADGDSGNGIVDAADFVIWRSSFGETEQQSATAGGEVGVAECDEYIKASTRPPSVIDPDADHLIAPIELNGTGDFLF